MCFEYRQGDTHLRQQGAGVGMGVSHSLTNSEKFQKYFAKNF